MAASNKKAAKVVIRATRKKLWLTRDSSTSSCLELHRNKPKLMNNTSWNDDTQRHEDDGTTYWSSKEGPEFNFCASGFKQNTGLKLKPGTCARVSITLTSTK